VPLDTLAAELSAEDTDASEVSEFRLPPLVVDYSDLWLEVDLRGDVKDWSRRAAEELLARQQWSGFRSRRGEKRTAELLGQAAGIAHRFQGASMCFLLIPSPTTESRRPCISRR
jgi:hypothetical protein